MGIGGSSVPLWFEEREAYQLNKKTVRRRSEKGQRRSEDYRKKRRRQ